MPGMMTFENVQIQLVDLPPISADFTEPWLPQAIRNANASVLVVDVNDAGSLEDMELVEASLRNWRLPLPGLLIGNKIDQPGGEGNFAALEDLYRGRYPSVAVSAVAGRGLDGFARAVFDLLGLVRVYTKVPGRKANLSAPYVLKRGATVLDAALHVHKDFAEHLKFARLYRPNGEHGGLMVERQHAVQDEDILEFHI
jgi:ribosome-interacting GTPase 1